MKKTFWAALAVSLSVPMSLLAQEKGPPPAVKTQQNLGAAGLLSSFYSSAQYGTTRTRMGENASRRGAAGAPFAPTTGYAHDSVTVIGGLTGRKLLQGGASYMTFGAGLNVKEEQPNLTDMDTRIPSFTVGYQNFANINTAYAASLTYSARDSKSATVHSRRTSVDLRFDVAHKINDQWGITGRLIHTRGDLKLDVTTPGGVVATVQPQTVWYGQSELVGNFAGGGIPAGWVLNPVIGVSYDVETTETSPGTKTSDKSGSVWAKATLTKRARPGTWSQNVTLGLEREYLQDGSDFIDEDTYGILGFGLSRMDKKGNNLNIAFERRQGFNGNRINNTLVTGYTFNF